MKKEYLKYLLRCINDPVYFIENEFRLNGELIRLSPHQRKMIRHIHKNDRSTLRVPRQVGTTTMFAAYATWFVANHPEKSVFINSSRMTDASLLLDIIREGVQALPDYYDIQLEENNKAKIKLSNNTRIISGTPIHAMGYSIDLLIMDNVDFADSKEDFMYLFPTVLSKRNGKITTCGGDFGFPTLKIA